MRTALILLKIKAAGRFSGRFLFLLTDAYCTVTLTWIDGFDPMPFVPAVPAPVTVIAYVPDAVPGLSTVWLYADDVLALKVESPP